MSSAAERRVHALARVARLQNGAIAACGVAVGAWWSGTTMHMTPRVALAALVAVTLATFANAFNDVCDVEIDRVAHPARPLPSGELSTRAALMLACGAAAAALVTSSLLSPGFAVASALVLALMALYSTHLKRTGLPGNLCVAALASLPFVYGAWAAGAPAAALPLFALAVPLHLARELAKDLDDAPGDRLGRATLPLTVGPRATRALFAGAIVIFLVVLAGLVVQRPLLGVLAVPALCLCALAIGRVVGGKPGGAGLLKAAMVLALVPLLVVRP